MENAAKLRTKLGKRTVLFVDEIHRFNRAQQDAFLPYVENGTIILIGATTENPSFEVNSALLSRVKVFVLEPLSEAELVRILAQALQDEARGLGKLHAQLSAEQLQRLAQFTGGDARSALTTLELAVNSVAPDEHGQRVITDDDLREALQRAAALYDKKGEQHYNLISAFIKSIRNSDPNATLYWLARMIEGGEDPMYIARRIVHHASEDIGLADPQALVVANAAKDAYDFLGSPEGELAIAQAVIYLGTANNGTRVCVSRKDSKVKTFDDVLTQSASFGAVSANDSTRDYGYLHKRTAGAQYNVVIGYAGTADIALAIERGEIDRALGVRRVAALRRIDDQRALAARHAQVDLCQQAGVEQGTVPLTRRVVDFQAAAQRVERVALAGVDLACEQQAVDDSRHMAGEAPASESRQLGVEKAEVEVGVVDHDLGLGDESDQLVDDALERRLVGEEVVAQAVHPERIGMARSARVDVVVQRAPGQTPVHHLDESDLDDAVALRRGQARRLGIEEDLSHHRAPAAAPALRPHHHHSHAPNRTIGRLSHWPMLMPSARMPRKLSGSRKYSATKRSTP